MRQKQARAERFWDTNRGTQIGNGQRYLRPVAMIDFLLN